MRILNKAVFGSILVISSMLINASGLTTQQKFNSDTNNISGFPQIANNVWQTCQEKQQQIEKQLQDARTSNNQKKINRLINQKTDVIKNCTNEDLRQKYTQKIDKLTNKVNQIQRKLTKAQVKGNNAKIANLQNKLDENTTKLKQAQQNLARFDQAVKR